MPRLRADPGGQIRGGGRSIQRGVYFYLVRNSDGSPGDPVLNLSRALHEVLKLHFRPGERYLETDDGTRATCIWVHRGTFPLRLRIADVRKSDLPLIDREGRLRPLNLASDEGVAEGTHLVVFADGRVGCEFNYYGPRIGRLSNYLEVKAPSVVPSVVFDPIIYTDTALQLRRLQSAKSVTFRIPAVLSRAVREVDESLGELLSSTAARTESPTVSIHLDPEPHSRQPIGGGALELVRRLFKIQEIRNGAIEFTVSGFDSDGRINEIDLLGGRLVAEETMVRQDDSSRAVNSLSAYEAIEAARNRVLPPD